MKISKTLAGVATAAALASVLTACTSANNSTGDAVPPASSQPSTTSVSATAGPSTIARIVSSTTATGGTSTAAPRPVQSQPAVPTTSSAPSAPATHTATASYPSSPPVLSGPVTFSSVAFQSPYNCAESGTGYYTAPNLTVAVDVTVLVNSPSLAKDLVIAAPNRAPRGLTNTSQWISATSLGGNVWRATYRTFVALSAPKYTPVTVTALQASANGSPYAIAFPSPLVVTLADCHS